MSRHVLGLVLGAAFALACAENQATTAPPPYRTQSAPSAPPASVSAASVAPTLPTAPRLNWSEIKIPFRGGDQISDVVGWHDGFVAIGFHCRHVYAVCLNAQPLSWTSNDGRKWSREAVDFAPGLAFLAVVVRSGRLLAVGDEPFAHSWRRVVLDSMDGVTWTREASFKLPRATRGGPCVGEAVPTWCTGRLLVASESLLLDVLNGDWTSRDGVDWDRLEFASVDAFGFPGGLSDPDPRRRRERVRRHDLRT
jgi:hypothetical protein